MSYTDGSEVTETVATDADAAFALTAAVLSSSLYGAVLSTHGY